MLFQIMLPGRKNLSAKAFELKGESELSVKKARVC